MAIAGNQAAIVPSALQAAAAGPQQPLTAGRPTLPAATGVVISRRGSAHEGCALHRQLPPIAAVQSIVGSSGGISSGVTGTGLLGGLGGFFACFLPPAAVAGGPAPGSREVTM